MQAATEHARKQTGTPIALHRNNVDGKGSCWGTHENYMMARAVPFDLVTRLMTLHFVTRQIYAGSGRVGIGENSEIPGYQLSQRADYIHAKVGLQTTFERPIINTRDESHSTDAYRRLHVIVGDANRMEVPQALKLGTTSMLLWLLEHADEAGFDLNAFLDELELSDPVEAIHTVSRWPTAAKPTHGLSSSNCAKPSTRLPHWSKVPTPPANPPGRTNPPHPLWRCGSRRSSTAPPSAMPPTMTNVWP